MRTKYYAYDRWVSLFIVTCETLITGGLFYLLFLTTEDTPWHKILQAPHLQVILTVMLCYFVSAMQAGVVLYRRKVYAYQILGKVLRSTICFGILSGVVLELGRFMDAWSYFYLTFLGLLFISLSVFRILMRWGLKRYRSKGGNLRYVVLVGSSENNRELYYELTMPGPVFFKQKRNGLNDKEFYCYKFRSMRVNTQADSLQATKDDPRKTRWGNIMRKTSIDELPQFINVLLGDMSVVGPRPHMLKHTEEYSKLINKYMVRHFVKPGITGWSQVTGYRGETKELKDMEGRIRGDIWYIEHWSFGLDLFIIYKTVMNAIHGEKNAY